MVSLRLIGKISIDISIAKMDSEDETLCQIAVLERNLLRIEKLYVAAESDFRIAQTNLTRSIKKSITTDSNTLQLSHLRNLHTDMNATLSTFKQLRSRIQKTNEVMDQTDDLLAYFLWLLHLETGSDPMTLICPGSVSSN